MNVIKVRLVKDCKRDGNQYKEGDIIYISSYKFQHNVTITRSNDIIYNNRDPTIKRNDLKDNRIHLCHNRLIQGDKDTFKNQQNRSLYDDQHKSKSQWNIYSKQWVPRKTGQRSSRSSISNNNKNIPPRSTCHKKYINVDSEDVSNLMNCDTDREQMNILNNTTIVASVQSDPPLGCNCNNSYYCSNCVLTKPQLTVTSIQQSDKMYNKLCSKNVTIHCCIDNIDSLSLSPQCLLPQSKLIHRDGDIVLVSGIDTIHSNELDAVSNGEKPENHHSIHSYKHLREGVFNDSADTLTEITHNVIHRQYRYLQYFEDFFIYPWNICIWEYQFYCLEKYGFCPEFIPLQCNSLYGTKL